MAQSVERLPETKQELQDRSVIDHLVAMFPLPASTAPVEIAEEEETPVAIYEQIRKTEARPSDHRAFVRGD